MSNKEKKLRNHQKIILASGSKARQKIIKKLKLKILFYTSGYEEDMSVMEDSAKLAEFLALGKAEYIVHQHPNTIIIGADTFIVVDGEKVGKPSSLGHARVIIEKMSGKWIEVISGLAVIKTNEKSEVINRKVTHEITRLKIKKMTEKEIQLLVNQKDALKMSGAFGIEGIGGTMVEKIEGDYDNVIGLPLKKLKKILKV